MRQKQRGQAVVEYAVFLAVLVAVLLFIIPAVKTRITTIFEQRVLGFVSQSLGGRGSAIHRFRVP